MLTTFQFPLDHISNAQDYISKNLTEPLLDALKNHDDDILLRFTHFLIRWYRSGVLVLPSGMDAAEALSSLRDCSVDLKTYITDDVPPKPTIAYQVAVYLETFIEKLSIVSSDCTSSVDIENITVNQFYRFPSISAEGVVLTGDVEQVLGQFLSVSLFQHHHLRINDSYFFSIYNRDKSHQREILPRDDLKLFWKLYIQALESLRKDEVKEVGLTIHCSWPAHNTLKNNEKHKLQSKRTKLKDIIKILQTHFLTTDLSLPVKLGIHLYSISDYSERFHDRYFKFVSGNGNSENNSPRSPRGFCLNSQSNEFQQGCSRNDSCTPFYCSFSLASVFLEPLYDRGMLYVLGKGVQSFQNGGPYDTIAKVLPEDSIFEDMKEKSTDIHIELYPNKTIQSVTVNGRSYDTSKESHEIPFSF